MTFSRARFWSLASASLLFTVFLSDQACASTVSYRSTHPIAWMHGLPTGESPGWNSKRWLITELQHGNYWNAPMDLKDLRTGDVYSYSMDFEQSLLQLEAGWELSRQLSVSVALPVLTRFGGVLDSPLDDWHRFVGADRFRRHQFSENKNNYSIKKNGDELLRDQNSEGLSHALLKFKYWFLQPKTEEGQAERHRSFRGMAASTQVRVPLMPARSELTTGNTEGSIALHAGARISSWLYAWSSAGLTKFAPSPLLQGWPTRQWSQYYELWFEFPLGDRWDFIVQARYESPLMDKQHLEYQYFSTTQKFKDAERSASGWSGLTAWRGTEALGFRYSWKEHRNFMFLFQEDWALGDNDGRGNFLYVHGAPDVALVGQMQVAF